MITTEQELVAVLNANGFVYQRVQHPAVFTCAEAELHRPTLPAVSTKNLFLCDKKARQFFLAVTACEKRIQLDELSRQPGVAHLRFASQSNLQRLLGVTRGAVTMIGLINDSERRVALWIDEEIWKGDYFLSHPLVNTATLIISKTELTRFFALTGHTPHFFKDGIATDSNNV